MGAEEAAAATVDTDDMDTIALPAAEKELPVRLPRLRARVRDPPTSLPSRVC